MSIIINWRNRNQTALTEIRVLRTTARELEPTLLDTVGSDVVTYEDETAEYNKLYFYQTVAVMGDVETKSEFFPAMSFRGDDSGPGPQTFLRGNHEFGLMGEVDVLDLPTLDEIAASSTVGRGATPPVATRFLKWCINGRIVYIPNVMYNASISLANMKTMLVKPNQDTQYFSFAKGRYTYKVRPPFATTLRDTIVGSGQTYPLDYTDDVKVSELAAYLRSMRRPATGKIGESMWDDELTAGTIWSNSYFNLSEVYMFYADGETAPAHSASATSHFLAVYELLLD